MKVLAIFLCAMLPLALATVTNVQGTVGGFTFSSSSSASSLAVQVKFTGLSTSLSSGAFTLAPSGSSGSYTGTLTGLATGNYTISDDGGATWSSSAVTSCTVPDVPPITLDTTTSTTFVPTSGSTRLRIRLRFLENNRYSSISYAFRGGEGNCNNTITSTTDTSYQQWTRTSSTSSCGAPYMQLEQDFNNALTTCNFQRDETDPNNTVFNATVVITTIDTGIVIRGSQYWRTLNTGVTIKISFQTNVSAVNNNPSIFGGHILYSAITQQLWNTNTFTATLTLITSVQWPYQLFTTASASSYIIPTVPSDWTTATLVPSPQDSSSDILHNAYTGARAACYSSTTATSAGATAQTYGQICNQYWTITLTRSANCGSPPVTLSGQFQVNFNLTCPAIFNGSCNIVTPGSNSITFTTNSTNYCPQLISNGDLNTATLLTWQTSAYSGSGGIQQNQFVFGTTTYFEATITAPILMSNVTVEYVYFLAGGVYNSATTPYYQRPYNAANPNAYFAPSAANTGAYGNYSGCSGGNFNTGASMQVTDNADGNTASFTKLVRFQILWNPCSSPATGDAPLATTVQVNVRIRYSNQTTSSVVPITMTLAKEQEHLLDSTEAGTATTTVAVQGSGATSAADSAAASSAMTIIGVVAGVVGVTALVVGLTVYMLRRRSKMEEQVNTVQLSSPTLA